MRDDPPAQRVDLGAHPPRLVPSRPPALHGPLDLLLLELTSSSEAAQALRQTSPFAGVLDPATRMKIWHEVRASAEAT